MSVPASVEIQGFLDARITVSRSDAGVSITVDRADAIGAVHLTDDEAYAVGSAIMTVVGGDPPTLGEHLDALKRAVGR